MTKAHPQRPGPDRDRLVRSIDECVDWAATCTGCADSCLGEDDVQELVRCIRLNLDCADACAQLRAASSPARSRAMLASSAQRSKPARRPVARGCDRHAEHHDHCRVCAGACRRCEQACNDILATTG
jgi:hypothetical protein